MDIYALDENYDVVDLFETDNVQWNRKYYEAGDFEIQVPKRSYSPEMKYVYLAGRKDLGIIHMALVNEETNKQFVRLTGSFGEAELNDKIVYPTFYAYGNIEAEIKRMINANKEDIPNLVVEPSQGLGGHVEFQESFGNLANVAYKTLESQQLSQKIEYDFLTKTKTYKIWQGKDRTQNQRENNSVVFSTELDNMEKTIASEDSENEKNWALVGGSGEGADRIFTTIDLSNGGYKKKIFINASSEQYDKDKETLAEYKSRLKQYGLEKMLKYTRIKNVDFTPVTGVYEYMKDYDLGDMCDIVIESLNISMQARIISIYEVWKENLHTIELEFGDKRLTRYEKERMVEK